MTSKVTRGRTRPSGWSSGNQITTQVVWSPFPVTELGPHGAPDAGPLPKAPEKQCPIFHLLEKRVSSHHLGVRESSLFFLRSFNALEKSLLCFKNSTRSKMAQGHQPSPRQSLRPSPHAQLPQRSARLRKASLSLPVSPHITPPPCLRFLVWKGGQTNNLYFLWSS